MRAIANRIVAAGLAVSAAGFLFPGAAVSETLLLEYGPIKALIEKNFVCAERVRLRLDAASDQVFSQEETVQQAVGAARAALGFQCDKMQDILISGTVANAAVYRAVATKASDWKIVKLASQAAPAQQPPSAPQQTTAPAGTPPPSPDSSITALAIPSPPTSQTGTPPDAKAAAPTAGTPSPVPAPPTGAGGIGGFRELQRTIEAGSFPVEDYKFPGLMTAIYLGRTADIPDDQQTRSLVASIYKAFTDNCGEGPSNVSLAMPSYASALARQITNDPMAGGLKALELFGQIYQQSMQPGGLVGAMDKFGNQHAMFTHEGVEDGKTFVSRHSCRGKEYSQFTATLYRVILSRSRSNPDPHDPILYSRLMSAAFRAQMKLPDPEEALKKRRIDAAIAKTNKTCASQYDSPGFCSCLVPRLVSADLSESDWSTISGDLKEIVSVSRQKPAVAVAVRACVRG